MDCKKNFSEFSTPSSKYKTMMDDGCPPLFKFEILMGDSYYLT